MGYEIKVSKLFVFKIAAGTIFSLVYLVFAFSNVSAQDSLMGKSPQANSFDGIQVSHISEGDSIDDGETDSGDDIAKQDYVTNEIIITYREQAPVLVDDNETGTNNLGDIEPSFFSQGFAIVSEDLASLGIETGGVEIFGGIESEKSYFVRFGDDVDPLQLSLQLNDIESIDWAQPNYIYRPLSAGVSTCYTDKHENNGTLDPCIDGIGETEAWHIRDIRLSQALNFVEGKRISKPTVAIIDPSSDDMELPSYDNGFDTRNKEYNHNLWDGSDCYEHVIRREDGQRKIDDPTSFNPNKTNCSNHGYDFYSNLGDSNDHDPNSGAKNQHATRVTSVLIGEKENGLGAYGVYQNGSAMLLRGGTTIDMIEAIYFAQQNGAKVINASWQITVIRNPKYNPTCSKRKMDMDGMLREAIKKFDGLFVAGAGNDKLHLDSTTYVIPQMFNLSVPTDDNPDCLTALPNIINVAGTQESGTSSAFWDYTPNDPGYGSNYSEDYVKIAAPAANIPTIDRDEMPVHSYRSGPASLPNGSTVYFYRGEYGTSLATPQVAGAAALMLSLNPDLSPAQLIRIINETGKVVSSLNGKVEGGKSLDVNAAVRRACELSARCHALMNQPNPSPTHTNNNEENGEDTRNPSDISEYVSVALPGAVFEKVATIANPAVTHDVRRYGQIGTQSVPAYNYRIRNVETVRERVPQYNYRVRHVETVNRRVPVYTYRVATYDTVHTRVPVYTYRVRKTRLVPYTVTVQVYNFDTVRTCVRHRGWWPFRRCVEWVEEEVRVEPYTEEVTRYRWQTYYETETFDGPRYGSNYRRIDPRFRTEIDEVVTYSIQTYDGPRYGSRYERVDPRFRTETSENISYTTERFDSPRYGSNYRRIDPRYVYEDRERVTFSNREYNSPVYLSTHTRIAPYTKVVPRYGYPPTTITVSDANLIDTGSNQDIIVRTHRNDTIIAETDYRGNGLDCKGVRLCRDNIDEFDGTDIDDVRVRYHGETEDDWDSLLRLITNRKDDDDADILGDSSKITFFEALGIMRSEGAHISVRGNTNSSTNAVSFNKLKTVWRTANSDRYSGRAARVRYMRDNL